MNAGNDAMSDNTDIAAKEKDAHHEPPDKKDDDKDYEKGADRRNDNSSEFKTVHFTVNATIFDEGDPGDAAYLIHSGRVEIRKGVHGGNPFRLAELEKGDVLGELALFDNRPRMASAVALTDVTAIRMSREEFLERLATMDPAMKGIVLTMVTRVRKMADEFMRRKAKIEWSNWNKPS
jgi:CRP-like cAMP-binding protein